MLRDFDCTPVSYPDIPSTHLHALWQVWDTALEDFLFQVPLPTPIEGDPYVYRSPILLHELLQSIAGQLSLFANTEMDETQRESAGKLCANALPIVFSACESGRHRTWAFNLLAVGFDLITMQTLQMEADLQKEISRHRWSGTGQVGPSLWNLGDPSCNSELEVHA